MEIVRKPFEGPVEDVMGGDARWEIKVHEHGLVALLDVMPRLVPKGKSADFAIVQAARVSYGEGTKQVSEDRGLIRYLYGHRHTSPLEMVEFKFHQVMPVFVARQWIRHRTANVNEYSARYSIVKDRFFRPSAEEIRKQSMVNKQGSNGIADHLTAQEFMEYLDVAEAQYQRYESLAAKGVAREIARIGLPLSMYTEWYWKIDLHNLIHFLGLRMDKHAQQEIRDYAWAIYELIKPIVPISMEAFMDYHPNMEGMWLSRQEIEALKNGWELEGSKREQAEFEAKKSRLNR